MVACNCIVLYVAVTLRVFHARHFVVLVSFRFLLVFLKPTSISVFEKNLVFG